MIIVQVDFLGGVYRAAEPTAPAWPEWPPAPDRIFQALVSAAASINANLEVLRALEAAPEIAFGRARAVTSGTTFVPAAYFVTSKREPPGRPNNAKSEPMMVGITDPVCYIWPDAPDSLRVALEPIVAALHYVGRAKSAAIVSIPTLLPQLPIHLIPSVRGAELLRVPTVGRLEELNAAFSARTRAPVATVVPYSDREKLVTLSPWDQLMALRLYDEVPLRLAAQLADALRTAALSVAGDDAPIALHGHAKSAHIAWATLPDVGHANAQGRVLGVGAWLPADISETDRVASALALTKISHLTFGGQRIKVGRLSAGAQIPAGLTQKPWVQTSQVWGSVTPLVFDRHPKRGDVPEAMVADAAERAGYPRPSAVHLDQHSAHRGSPPAKDFRPRRGGRWTHAVLEFATPISGPVLIGRDRYFGLGLMRALR